MPAVFDFARLVRPDDIDLLGHVNNLVYLKWMQSAAVAHSDAQGWPTERYRGLGAGWVVRSHQIEYLQPAFADHGVIVRTWVADLKKISSLRRYQILRDRDEAVLATAATNWAFIDFSTHRLTRIPSEVAEAFEIVED